MYYDEALPRFAAIVHAALGQDEIFNHVFLRDAAGRLTFIALGKTLTVDQLDAIRRAARELTPWVDSRDPVATPEDIFDVSLGDSSEAFPEYIQTEQFTGYVRVIEHRIVGQDWLRPPAAPVTGLPPVVVFASHKGGVGRSTALSVAAAAFSREGFNLLVVDLDLEAPGLGAILLPELPRFGALDYFVESGLTDVDDAFLDQMIAVSSLTEGGLVNVVPAVGTESNGTPQNVLGKIARSYVERMDEDDHTVSFLDRTRSLITRLCSRASYDAVFIDARAGLNEATAAAVLGLGAEILLFGVDTPQTFSGYRFFLAHLQRFRPSESGEGDWRYRIRMVHSKSQAGAKAQADFRTRAFELFSETLYDEENGIDEKAFNFDYDDATAPHYAWPILNDSNFTEFNPIERGDQLGKDLYDRTFGPFITALGEKIGLKQ